MSKLIYLIIPLHNEEEVIPELYKRLDALAPINGATVKFVLVDDGSKDKTAQMITDLAENNDRVISLILSRNYGHQNAVSAGLSIGTEADACMVIDGDLQDPPEMIHDFYKHIEAGFDVVYGVRKKRKESIFKRFCYWAYYRLFKMASDIYIPLDAGDFCMMSRRVVVQMNALKERNRYLRGMRAWIGYKQIGVPYEREERAEGESKYSLKKLIQLAKSGFYNFSEFPIHLMSRLGLFSSIVSFVYIIYILYKKIIYGDTPEGFVTIILAISFFSGLILFSLSILGEYILRIFNDVRERPSFIIDEIVENQKKRRIG